MFLFLKFAGEMERLILGLFVSFVWLFNGDSVAQWSKTSQLDRLINKFCWKGEIATFRNKIQDT